MKRVKRTKNPTPSQLQNITHNLNKAYPNRYSAAFVESMTYSDGRTEMKYYISQQGGPGKYLDSWDEMLDLYEKLMKEAKNG